VGYAGRSVSVDPLESHMADFIGQMKGVLTMKWYTVAKGFIPNFPYVHLQTSTKAVKTLEAKEAFEKFALIYSVKISHYNADNGRFV
jgi:chloramphenicol O-acetyltransferase